jgi:hypothetical protein
MPQLLFLQISTRDNPFVCSLAGPWCQRKLWVRANDKRDRAEGCEIEKKRTKHVGMQPSTSAHREENCMQLASRLMRGGFISFPARKGKKKKERIEEQTSVTAVCAGSKSNVPDLASNYILLAATF